MSETRMAYVSRCAGCNNIMMATLDSLERKRETAKEIAKAVRLGEVVERMPLENARSADFGCTCDKAKP